jgi:hypothetical protein
MANKDSGFNKTAMVAFLTAGCLWLTSPTLAIELGKTYDRSNFQKVEGLLIPAVRSWVAKGEFILRSGNLDFEWQKDGGYLTESLKNEGRYEIDDKGVLVEKASHAPPEHTFGYPFPKIDPKDPLAAEKIMENNGSLRYNLGSMIRTDRITFVGSGGPERVHVATTYFLSYQNRSGTLIPNPDGFLDKQLIRIDEPFDIRGMIQMAWTYQDARQDASWVYDT